MRPFRVYGGSGSSGGRDNGEEEDDKTQPPKEAFSYCFNLDCVINVGIMKQYERCQVFHELTVVRTDMIFAFLLLIQI